MTRSGVKLAAPMAVLLVLIAAASGCGGHKSETDKVSEYVALGDSYTAGAGMNPVKDKPCRRSEINYPSLVDKALKIKSFADRSCAGARTGNLEEPQTYQLQQLNAPQLNAVGKTTKLVTIGMGLNDNAISTGLLLICITLKSAVPNEVCQQYLRQPQSTIDAQIRGAANDVKTAIETIKKKAPDARIVVIGYPRVAPDQGSCGAPGQTAERFPVPEAQLARLRDSMKFADEAWSDVAKQTGSLYVDMYDASKGHDICSDDPWIAGYLGVTGKAAGLHPLPAYAKAVAAEVVKVLDN
jgi:lysophospholipase L1-like esterase